MIEAIYFANKSGGDQRRVDSVELIKGKGIAGDRNFAKTKHRGQNITFIEREEIDHYNLTFGQSIGLADSRRNVVTVGVKLNGLVDKVFKIGAVTFIGIELCEPCVFLGRALASDTMEEKAVVKAFVHKGGLRADVLSSGFIEVGMGFVEVSPG